jgi:hypothetical protein
MVADGGVGDRLMQLNRRFNEFASLNLYHLKTSQANTEI